MNHSERQQFHQAILTFLSSESQKRIAQQKIRIQNILSTDMQRSINQSLSIIYKKLDEVPSRIATEIQQAYKDFPEDDDIDKEFLDRTLTGIKKSIPYLLNVDILLLPILSVSKAGNIDVTEILKSIKEYQTLIQTEAEKLFA